MLRSLLLALGLAVLVTACGRGEPEDTGPLVEEVRVVMTKLIEASVTDDLAAARANLDVGQYLMAMDSPQAFEIDKMSKEDLELNTQSCFNQLKAVPNQSTLKDAASIEAAMKGAKIEILPQTRRATVHFQGTDAQRASNVVKFTATLTQTPGGIWKLIKLELIF